MKSKWDLELEGLSDCHAVWKAKVPSTQSKRVTYVSTEASFKEDLKFWKATILLESWGINRVLRWNLSIRRDEDQNGPIILLISFTNVKEIFQNFQKLKFPLKNRMMSLSFPNHRLLKDFPVVLQAIVLLLWSCPTRAHGPLDRGEFQQRVPNFLHVIVVQEKMN